MVLCRCKRKAVLFCFDHRKAICGNCMDEHTVCTIKTYIEWLKNTAFEAPVCCSCREAVPSVNKPTVRLTCLHVVHSACLIAHLNAAFSPSTALAGFVCPLGSCRRPLLPPSSTASATGPSSTTDASVAATFPAIRSPLLQLFNSAHVPQALQAAAREELGLPPAASKPDSSEASSIQAAAPPTPPAAQSVEPRHDAIVKSQVGSRKATTSSAATDDDKRSRGGQRFVARDDDDADEDKYRRRSVKQLCQFLGIIEPAQPVAAVKTQRPLSSPRQLFIIFTLLAAVTTTIMLYFLISASPDQPDDDDPFAT